MLLTVSVFFLLAITERFFAGYKWPHEPHWVLRGLFWLGFTVTASHFFSQFFHSLLYPHALFDLSFMGLWAIVPSILIYELFVYAYHRALHGIPVLWRIHQWHHSSERIDIWSAFRVHPLELFLYPLISIIVFSLLFGTTANTAFLIGVIIVAVQTFQHANLKTPRWLGYIIARPENHMLHHARDGHRANYADFSIIDMIFGTFEMPEKAPEQVGFWDGASRQIRGFMTLKDVASKQNESTVK